MAASQTELSMKKTIIFCGLICSLSAFSQATWQKLSASQAADFGLSYSLPKTKLVVDVEFTKTTFKAGPYFRYAQNLLGISQSILEDSETYQLDKVSVIPTSVVDKSTTCMVQFKSALPYIVLSPEGVLSAVNTQPDTTFLTQVSPLPRNFIIEQALQNPQLTQSEETLASGSVGKMAEQAAKQIFRIRESRTELLTGEADNAPKDGAGLKLLIEQMDLQEKRLTALFTGSIQKEKMYKRLSFVPGNDDVNRFVLFRFSKYFGYVNADDLSGEPVYIDLTATDRKTFAPEPKKKSKEKPGLAYTISGRGQLTISYRSQPLFQDEFPFTQFGIQANFPAELFSNKKAPAKVVLNPQTGAIVRMMP